MWVRFRKIIVSSSFFLLVPIFSEGREAIIIVHLRGVHESKINFFPLNEENSFQSLFVVNSVEDGDSVIFRVPDNILSRESILRFDYRENKSDTPYPSDKRIIIANQDLGLWLHLVYCNNPDSIWFQKDEKENTAYFKFLKENSMQKEEPG